MTDRDEFGKFLRIKNFFETENLVKETRRIFFLYLIEKKCFVDVPVKQIKFILIIYLELKSEVWMFKTVSQKLHSRSFKG